MKIRSMIAAAVRPWFSVRSGPKYIEVTVGNHRRCRPHVGIVVHDRISGNDTPRLWLGSRWFKVGDLHIGVAHSESWRRVPTREEKPANDGKAA